MNRCRRIPDDGLMHAVVSTSSLSRWRDRDILPRVTVPSVLEIARDRRVEQVAQNETPEKLNRDRRLVLLSDPVTMARLHYRVRNAREILFLGKPLSVFKSWNPQALQGEHHQRDKVWR